jgi:hypothetical protein
VSAGAALPKLHKLEMALVQFEAQSAETGFFDDSQLAVLEGLAKESKEELERIQSAPSTFSTTKNVLDSGLEKMKKINDTIARVKLISQITKSLESMGPKQIGWIRSEIEANIGYSKSGKLWALKKEHIQAANLVAMEAQDKLKEADSEIFVQCKEAQGKFAKKILDTMTLSDLKLAEAHVTQLSKNLNSLSSFIKLSTKTSRHVLGNIRAELKALEVRTRRTI